jgi:Effector Associated Constant Component 1
MIEHPLTLSLTAAIPDTRIARLTSDLGRDLTRQGIKALPVETAPVPGERGEPVTLGVLALASGGALKALIGCLKAYLSHEPSLVIKLKQPNGAQIEVNARNIDAPDLRAALKAVASASSA